jgi:hypothetical protein
MAALSRLMLSLSRPIVMGVRDELRRCFFMALAALFALLGVVMFAVSLFLYLRASFGAPLAAAVVAGALLIVSGLIVVATYRLRGDGTSKPSCGEAPRETAQSFQGQDAPMVGNDSASLQLALAALLAGAAVGASADLRQGLGSVFLALCGTKPRHTP